MTQNVYRVVKTQYSDVEWVSPSIYLTRDNVLFACKEQAKSLEQYAEYTVEDYDGSHFDSVCMSECGRDKWVTVERLYKVTDKNGYSKVIGFISYPAV